MVEKKYKDKAALVAQLHEELSAASAVVITEYRGLKAGELVALRSKLREGKVKLLVVKNSLLRRAAEGTSVEPLVGDLQGPIAVALGFGEAVEAAKAISKGSTDHEPFNLRGGIIEASVLDEKGIVALAKLPGRSEMQSQFAGALEGFVGEFVYLVEAVVREFAGLLEAQEAKLAS